MTTDESAELVAPDPSPTRSPKARVVRLSIAASVTAIVLVLASVGAAFAYNGYTHSAAITTAESKVADLEAAVQAAVQSAAALNEAVKDGLFYSTAATEILSVGKDFISEKNATAITEQNSKLIDVLKPFFEDQLTEDENIAPDAVFEADTVDVKIPDVNPSDSDKELAAQSKKLDEAIAEQTKVESTNNGSLKKVDTESAKLLALLSETVADVDKTTEDALKAYPSASAESKAALTAATELVNAIKSKVENRRGIQTVQVYFKALQRLKKSHVDVETQKAIDAANAAGAATYTDPATGQTKPNPNYGGGGSGGSGGSGGGSGGSGGGSGSNWAPLKLVVSGSTCVGAGGSQEVTYGSTLMPPGNGLLDYSTYEIPGYGWGVTWRCDPGF